MRGEGDAGYAEAQINLRDLIPLYARDAGNQYWKFMNMEALSGYPKSIQEGFPGIPANLDAATVWGGNGKIYFFKGEKFWKFDPESRPFIRCVYN
jgi:matrix metalloproteinase-14 (membrane-inserted)